MGSNSSNSYSLEQNVTTSILNASKQTCESKCESNQSGNVVIIDNGKVGGSAGFSQSCSAQASCVMNTQLDSNVESVIGSVANQSNTAVTSILGDLSFNQTTNSANIKQNITNFVTNMSDSTCKASVALNQTNNLFVASNSDIGGFAGFQSGVDPPATANSSCTMSNLSKVVVYNQAQSESAQKNTQISLLAIIIIAIIAILLIGGLVFMFAIFGKKK